MWGGSSGSGGVIQTSPIFYDEAVGAEHGHEAESSPSVTDYAPLGKSFVDPGTGCADDGQNPRRTFYDESAPTCLGRVEIGPRGQGDA